MRTPCTDATSLIRAACAGAGHQTAALARNAATRSEARRIRSIGCMVVASNRQDVEEEAAQPADALRLGLGAAAALLDPHVGDLRRRNDVAALDHVRVDLAGEAQDVDVVVDADLLLAGDEQVAVRQHAGDAVSYTHLRAH